MVMVGDVELTDKEFDIINKFKGTIAEFTAKRPTGNDSRATSAKVYIPKEWIGSRVLLLRLKDVSEDGTAEQ